jgi:hypothetical protein
VALQAPDFPAMFGKRAYRGLICISPVPVFPATMADDNRKIAESRIP